MYTLRHIISKFGFHRNRLIPNNGTCKKRTIDPRGNQFAVQDIHRFQISDLFNEFRTNLMNFRPI